MSKSSLFKDKPEVNNLSHYEREAEKILKTIEGLFRNNAGESYNYDKPLKRSDCGHFSAHTANGKEYEKRICKCMYFYNTDNKKQCDKCLEANEPFFSLKIEGNFKIVSYEVVPISRAENIGNIDILLSDGINYYATEVKPPKSDETLMRMVAEIMTYCNSGDINPSVKKDGNLPVKKAICFFEGSMQDKMYSNSDFEFYGKNTKKLIDLFGIKVFRLSVNEGNKTCSFNLLN